jgi:hypothetical protein
MMTTGGEFMELSGAGGFYTLAELAMAFAGFTAIVVVLRQSAGKPLSQLHVLFTSVYVELGLMASTFAMMAPVLALCRISETLVWRISSALMLAILVPWLCFFPFRRKRAAPEIRLPLRFFISFSIGMMVVIALCLNMTGWLFDSGPGPLAIATIYVLAFASVLFLGNYYSYLRD